jgi:hypothetical protein
MIKNRMEKNVVIGLAQGAHSFIDNFEKSANFVKFDLIFLFSLNGRIVLHLDA